MIEGPSRVPLTQQLEQSSTQTAGLETTGDVYDTHSFPSIFDPPDEDRVLDSGWPSVLAAKRPKERMLFIYCDPETKRLWDKVVPERSGAHFFFARLQETLLRGLAKRRMQALGKGPRPHICKSSSSEQVAWLKKAFDFDVTITFRVNGKDAFEWTKLEALIEEIKTDDRWKRFRSATAS